MAGLGYTPGTGATVRADLSGSDWLQVVRLDGGTGSTQIPLVTDENLAALPVTPRAKRVRIAATPTITAGAYVAGYAVGGLLTFANAVRTVPSGPSTGKVEQVVVVDKSNQAPALDVVFFTSTPSTTPTDHAAYDPADADLALVLGVANVGAFWSQFADNAVCGLVTGGVWNIDLPIVCAGTSLYAVIVSRGTPTFASTSDISVILTIAQD